MTTPPRRLIYNLATGQVEQWQRKYFTIEENGSFKNGEIHNDDRTASLNGGLKGTFGNSRWGYELALGYSQNTPESVEPALVAAKAQALYLGPSLRATSLARAHRCSRSWVDWRRS